MPVFRHSRSSRQAGVPRQPGSYRASPSFPQKPQFPQWEGVRVLMLCRNGVCEVPIENLKLYYLTWKLFTIFAQLLRKTALHTESV